MAGPTIRFGERVIDMPYATVGDALALEKAEGLAASVEIIAEKIGVTMDEIGALTLAEWDAMLEDFTAWVKLRAPASPRPTTPARSRSK
jgi:hypothetical protein